MRPIRVSAKMLVSPANHVQDAYPVLRRELSSTQGVAIVCFVVASSETYAQAVEVLRACETVLLASREKGRAWNQRKSLAVVAKYLVNIGVLSYAGEDEALW